MNVTYPDYNRSIINLMATVARSFGVETKHKTLQELPVENLKKSRNVIVMLLDGFGWQFLNRLYPDTPNFFQRNNRGVLTSVFPPTTAAAITSLLTLKNPLEHGCVGWSMYFKDYFKMIDFLPNRDSQNGESLDAVDAELYGGFKSHNIFSLIRERSPETQLHSLVPKSIAKSLYTQATSSPAEVADYSSYKTLFKKLLKTVKAAPSARKFIYVYSVFPDALLHSYGFRKDVMVKFARDLEERLKAFILQAARTKTTLIITADHGLIDINKYHYVKPGTELHDCLALPLFPEARFTSYFVKGHRKKEFEELMGKYKDEFLFMKRDAFFRKKLLGDGVPDRKIDDQIGDYVTIGIKNSCIKSAFRHVEKKREHKAHHSGLTDEEMLVPLIVFEVP
jgi:hypothetical protein